MPIEDDEFRRRIDELTKEARKADREDLARAQLFQRLVAGEAWNSYVGLLNARIQGFSELLLSPSGSVDGAVALEFVKGAMFGLIMARDLPSVVVSSIVRTVEEDDEDAA